MVRLIARSALATAVSAAMAVPLALSASAAGTPSLPAPSVTTNLQQTLQQLVPVPLAPAAPSSPAPTASPNDSSSSGSANALDIPALNTCIGCSDGTSSSTPNGDGTTTNSSSSDATGVKILGINLAGGSSSSTPNSGDVLAVPVPGLLNLAIGDWIANATNVPSTFSRGSLLDLNLNKDGTADYNQALTQLITLAVLEGKTTTTASCEAGGATGETNGARLNLGNSPTAPSALAVLLLHTDASTNGGSHVYLASINGTQIFNSQQVGGNPINITIPGLTTISLLATPGTGCSSSGGNPGGGGNNNPPGVCPPGIVSIQLPPGTCLGSGLTATQTSTSSNANAGVQAASTGNNGGVGVPTTGVGLGILGFLLLGGGLLALGTSRVARRWRNLT